MADSVEIVLGANVSKAVAGLTQFGNVAKIAVGTATAALEELVRRSIEFADQIGKAAQKAGVAVEQFSQLAYSGKLADASAESLTTAFRGLSKAIAENNKDFNELGIATLNADGSFRDSYDVLLDVAQVFKELPDGVRKTTLATNLFGRSGQELIPLLNAGRDGLRAQAQEARDLGVVVSQKFANDAQEFRDNLTRIGQALLGVGISIAEGILPELNRLSTLGISTFVSLRKSVEMLQGPMESFIKYLATGVVYAQEFAEAFFLLFSSGNLSELQKSVDELREDTKRSIDEIWNAEKRLGDEQEKRARDNIAYLSEEDRIRHQIFVHGQLFDDYGKNQNVSEYKRRDDELFFLQAKLRLQGKLVDSIEKNAAPGGFGVMNADGTVDDSKTSEAAKAYDEKLLPAMREYEATRRRIEELEAEGTFSGRLARNLGEAASQALNLSARLADAFGSAIMTGIDGLAAGITGLIDGTRSWGQVMQQMGSQILGMFVQLIVRALALYAIISLLNLVSPSLGSAIGKFAGISGGKASGGPVGSGLYAVGEQGTEYVVNNPTLARFGTGFFDSLQRGGSAPAATPSGGGGASVHVALLNEQHQYHNWLQSTEGERVVVDIVGRNIHRFRS